MNTQDFNEIQKTFDELADEIRDLGTQHNYLCESVAELWGLVGRTSSDPLIKNLCARRIEALELVAYESPQAKIKPKQ